MVDAKETFVSTKRKLETQEDEYSGNTQKLEIVDDETKQKNRFKIKQQQSDECLIVGLEDIRGESQIYLKKNGENPQLTFYPDLSVERIFREIEHHMYR